MSQADYARHRGKSRQYISRLAKEGVLVMRNGNVDVVASDAVLDDRPVDIEPAPSARATTVASATATESGGAAQQPGSYAQARLADMVYRAKLRRLDFDVRSGKLISVDEVKVRWFAHGRQIRDRLLALPSKLARQLAALTDAKEVRDLLDTEITAMLKGLQEEIRYRRAG